MKYVVIVIDSGKTEGTSECTSVCMFPCVCVCLCIPSGRTKETHQKLCQQHHTSHLYRNDRSLLLSLSHTFTHRYTHTHTQHKHLHFSVALNAFLPALEQAVRQATGTMMLLSLMGKSFETRYIINIWLEDVTLTIFSYYF